MLFKGHKTAFFRYGLATRLQTELFDVFYALLFALICKQVYRAVSRW